MDARGGTAADGVVNSVQPPPPFTKNNVMYPMGKMLVDSFRGMVLSV